MSEQHEPVAAPVIDWADLQRRASDAEDKVRLRDIEVENLREQVVALHRENLQLKKTRRSILYELFDWTPSKKTT